jgi:hypothetical protein
LTRLIPPVIPNRRNNRLKWAFTVRRAILSWLAISALSHPCSSSSTICCSRGPSRTACSFIPTSLFVDFCLLPDQAFTADFPESTAPTLPHPSFFTCCDRKPYFPQALAGTRCPRKKWHPCFLFSSEAQGEKPDAQKPVHSKASAGGMDRKAMETSSLATKRTQFSLSEKT